MTILNYGFVALGLAATTGCSGVFDSHSCTAIGFIPETTLTLDSPGNMWNAATYGLALTFEGATVACTMDVTPNELASPNVVSGTCSATNVAWSLQPVCPQSPAVCNGSTCTQTASSANCLAGQFQMIVNITAAFPAGGGDGLPATVVVELAGSGGPLVNESVMPTQTTTEPNGSGCGFVTRGAATIAVGSGAG